MKKSDWLAIPNLLSLLRIILIPVFIYQYINAETDADYLWAAFTIILSGITDWLDGVIARRYNMITDLGKLLDPAADKLTQLAIIICLVFTWDYIWIVVVIFIIKEVSLIICDILLLRQGRVMDGALWYGKVSTATFYTCSILLVAFPNMDHRIAYTLMFLTAVGLLFAFISYTRWFIIELRKKPADK
ncbi:CDP-alcohol phosphatidyltransferase family protein [Fundicoccus culcitae]|uniref:CDP-diacylglycerol--glycerol-3-phosphate 3-phosphatidyltransferase n=1 Tax=Fundicoccus culcitae TaxID=2969821 RepID=A0ABY5P4L5_9LACT|nr:CDP-alcohol phosphatidyltransferase family protein [Fundicoccus culcitae]UUX33682.1 CDP-alcohol phosphatidyltransferase family protein [Fundicoccus culcitae]